MDFWLDTEPTGQLGIGDCSPECVDDCTDDCFQERIYLCNKSPDALLSWSGEDTFGSLKLATPLYVRECAEDRWIACNPTGEGRIVVLDRQAMLLLEQFRTAKSLAEVLPVFINVSPEGIKRALALLYHAGLLQDPLSLPVMNTKAESNALSAWLHVTNACNLRCHYCYLEKTTEDMSEDTAFRAVDAVFRSAIKRRVQLVHFRYAGGEASLHMSRVTAIHDYASQLAQQHDITLKATLLSNGVILSKRAIDNLKSRRIGVTISLDGIGDYHDRQRPFLHGQGSFKYVDRTIQTLLAHDLPPYITVIVSQRNLEGLPDLLTYLLERGLSFTLSYYRDNECSVQPEALQFGEQSMISGMLAAFAVIERHLPKRSLLSSLIDKASLLHPHQRTCGVGHNYLVIDQRGGIAKCQAAIQQTVTTIAAEDPLLHIREDRKGVQGLAVDEKEGCRTCDWRYWCSGGCPLLTHRLTNRYDIKSPNCHIYQALFPEALRLEALRLLKYTTPIMLN